ncbi:hypothetical protein D3C81_1741480 [compost metagenome]
MTPVRLVVLLLLKRRVSTATAPGALLSTPVVKPTGLPASNVRMLKALCTDNGDFASKVSCVGNEFVTVLPPMVIDKSPAAIVLT